MKRFDTKKFELDITYRCNLKCNSCSRRCDLVPPTEPDMQPEYLEEQFAEAKRIRHRFQQVCLMGGEPTLHRHIGDFLRIIQEHRCKIVVVSNCHGKHALKVLHDIETTYPNAEIRRSQKITPSKLSSLPSEYWALNVAPIDFPEFEGYDFTQGCEQQCRCGFQLTPVGWFPCSVGGGAYRVFGFEGQELRDAILQPNFHRLCRVCGRLRRSFFPRRSSEKKALSGFDESWRQELFVKSIEQYPVFSGERILSKTYEEALHGRQAGDHRNGGE